MSATGHVRRSRPRGKRLWKKQGKRDQRPNRDMGDGMHRRERVGDDRILYERDMSPYARSHSGDGFVELVPRWREEEQSQRGSLDRDAYYQEHEERLVSARFREDLEREQLQQRWDELDRLDRERYEVLVAESRSRTQSALLQSELVSRMIAERSAASTTIHRDPLFQSHIPNEQISNKEMISPAVLGATGQTLDRNPAQLSVTAASPSTQLVGKVAQATVSSSSSVCPLMSCRANVPSLQEHVLYTHLPACFADISDTSSTTLRRRNMVLHAFAQEFTGGEGLPGLLEMVESSGLMSKAAEVEADWLPALQAFSEFLGETVPTHYTLHPPNACAVLTHWQVLLQLLCAAGKDMQERYSQQSLAYKIQQAPSQAAVEPSAISSFPGATAAQSVTSKSVTGSEGYIAAGQGNLFQGGHNISLFRDPSRAGPSARPSRVDPGSVQSQTETGKYVHKRKRTPSPVGIDMGSDRVTFEYGHVRNGEPAEVQHGAVMRDSYGSGDMYTHMPPGPAEQLTMPPSMTSPSESRYRERRVSPPPLSEYGRRWPEGHVQHDLDMVDERPPRPTNDQAFQGMDSMQTVSSRNLYTTDVAQDTGIDQSTSRGVDKSNSDVPAAVDCHFYLDVLAMSVFGKDRLRKTFVGVNILQSSCSAPETNHIRLVGGIGTFSNPEHYDMLPDSRSGVSGVEKARWHTKDGRLGLSVGLNPKYCKDVTDSLLQRISDLARLPCMKAFGDVGLSYSRGSENDWAQQRTTLRRLLRLAPSSLPIKLSCRKLQNPWKNERNAYHDLLDIAKDELSPLQPIYLVSFSGSVDVVEDWIARFPNCYFGISPKCISSESAADVRNAIRYIPDDHILLESSAPAFQLPGYKKNSPLFLGLLAMYVAKIRGVDDARHLLNVTTENAKRLFKLA